MNIEKIERDIANKHKLGGGAKGYFARFNALHGGNAAKGDFIGKAPDGFAPFFEWDRKAEEVRLSVLLNAADSIGAMIAGMKAGDTISITSASGIASFSQSSGSLAASLIGLTASVAGGVVIAEGGNKDATKMIVDGATKFAEAEFKKDKVKKKRRDAFGVDPGTQHKARQEGGVLICFPEAGGTLYSGKDKKLWIKHHAPRTDAERPGHVTDGIFLVKGDTNHMSRRIGADGEIYIVAWDHKFRDNAGFYHVRLRLKRPLS